MKLLYRKIQGFLCRLIGRDMSKSLCSICKKRDEINAFKPFCSKRCADIDLGRWLKDGYAIPTEEPAPDPANEP